MGGIVKSFFGGGGDDSSGQMIAQQQAEEARKAALRGQINTLFGVKPDGSVSTGGDDAYGKAATQFAGEETDLGNSIRDYYTTQQKRAYDDSLRQLNFGTADTGNTNSSAFADAKSRLDENDKIASTRIADAVQQAVTGLRTAREGSRANAVNLVNSGSGADAVAAASSGLKGAFDTARSSQKQDLFSDLFSNLAFSNAAGNANSRNANLAALFQQKGNGISYPYSPSSGTVVRG